MGLDYEQEEQIRKLYLKLFKSLYAYAYASTNDTNYAQEAIQETFRIVCTKPNECLSSSNPSGWIMQTLKNVLSNFSRHRATLNKYFINIDPTDYEQLSKVDDADPDLLFSGTVSPEDFALLKYVVLYNHTIKEAAEEFGLPFEGCKKRLQRIKKKIRDSLEE